MTSTDDQSESEFTAIDSDERSRWKLTQQQITARWQDADGLIAGAKALLEKSTHVKGRMRAEKRAREALAKYRSALDWAEDTPWQDDAHRRMDEAGGWVRRTFGCHLSREGDEYWQECPVALGHNRIGLSVGGYGVRTCSLCGGDLSECEHRPGTVYRVPGGSQELGWCRVCRKEGDCEHDPTKTYEASVVSIITEFHLDEVSLVSRPAFADARILRVPVDISELQDRFPGFIGGMEIACNRCLEPCSGLAEHDLTHS